VRKKRGGGGKWELGLATEERKRREERDFQSSPERQHCHRMRPEGRGGGRSSLPSRSSHHRGKKRKRERALTLAIHKKKPGGFES